MSHNVESSNPRSSPDICASWEWDESQIRRWQLDQFNAQLRQILPTNRFYREKFACPELQLADLSQLGELPLTTKEELVASVDDSPHGFSAHHTFARSAYSRLHRTSGTTGKPLMILDTQQDWQWWSDNWQHVLEAGQVTPQDRVFLAFSFGPFIGFWSAHQACADRGALVIPGGGLSSMARLEFMRQSAATVVCCTPSYALHLAEVAAAEHFDLAGLPVERMIVAGEAGGSVPATRGKIEKAWQVRVIDHSGATEIGPWAFGWPEQPGLHVNESSFIAELLPIDASSGGELAELVLTSLGRIGAPVIRYRTGDAVRATRPTDGRCRFLWLPDGIVGRVDNMVTIRGVNIFPSSIDAIVRESSQVAEYRVLVTQTAHLDQLAIEIEASDTERQKLEKALTVRLGLRIPVRCVSADSLPRSEGKSLRWQDQRGCES